MKYLKQFVVGSSYLAFVPLVFLLNKYEDHEIVNYDFNKYVLVAPLWWGVWNVISLIIAEYFGLNTNIRYILITSITSILIILYAKYNRVYNFKNNTQLAKYAIFIFISYIIIWNIIIKNLEKHM